MEISTPAPPLDDDAFVYASPLPRHRLDRLHLTAVTQIYGGPTPTPTVVRWLQHQAHAAGPAAFVYVFHDLTLLDCLYVGLTSDPARRFTDHRLAAATDEDHWIHRARALTLLASTGPTPRVAYTAARYAETTLIHELAPIHNVLGRDQ